MLSMILIFFSKEKDNFQRSFVYFGHGHFRGIMKIIIYDQANDKIYTTMYVYIHRVLCS